MLTTIKEKTFTSLCFRIISQRREHLAKPSKKEIIMLNRAPVLTLT